MTAARLLGLVLAATTALPALPARATSSTSPAVPVLIVSVGGPPDDPAFLPVHVAAALRTFDAEGVRVTLRRAKHPTAAMADVRDGEAGVAVTTMDQAIRGGPARGTPVRIVLAHTRAPAVAVLVSARHRSEVTRLEDLRGRRVGIPGPGTTGATVLTALLRQRKIEPWHLELVSQGAPALTARLGSGDLVAAALEEPWASRAIASGRADVLVDLRRPEDAAKALGGPFYEVVSAARSADKELAALEPALAAYARAVIRVQAWLARTRPADAVARLPNAFVTDPDRLAARLETQQEAYVATGEPTAAGIAATLEVLKSGSPWPASLKVTAKTLAEPAAVTAARTRLGPTPPDP